MTATIAVKNWDRFQHYADRDPTWIKLYRDVLTSQAWVLGTDISRLLQIAITLLAARYKNAIPNNFALIKKVAHVDCSEPQFQKALTHLSKQNFLEIQGVEQVASTALAERYQDASPEKRREEKRRGEERREEKILSSKLDHVVEVFDHWKLTWNHPRSQLDLKRTKTIKDALLSYGVADLCLAITGYLNSPFHTGQNDRRTVYDRIELLLKDSSHIDDGIRFASRPMNGHSAQTIKNINATAEWIPPELQNAKH